MRVHKLAKEYGIKSTEFLTEIQGYGINVFSHLSGLSDDEVATIRQKKEEEPLATSLGVIEPLEDSGRDDEETDTGLSFGQQAFARAKENDEDVVEIQEVEVEKPRGFWGWLGSLFT